jgi:hypothetical protein
VKSIENSKILEIILMESKESEKNKKIICYIREKVSKKHKIKSKNFFKIKIWIHCRRSKNNI